jgi:hypothetical protein
MERSPWQSPVYPPDGSRTGTGILPARSLTANAIAPGVTHGR